jgi:hypothetical protein
MRYYRCKCGNSYSWSSMGQPTCRGCKKCNTTLEEGPSLHTAPEPHKWVAHKWVASKVLTDEGEKDLTVCSWCGILKVEFEAKQKQTEVENGRH